VAVLSERLAVAFFVTLTPNVTVFANAGEAAATTSAAVVSMHRILYVCCM
jgi:hypothetical protein